MDRSPDDPVQSMLKVLAEISTEDIENTLFSKPVTRLEIMNIAMSLLDAQMATIKIVGAIRNGEDDPEDVNRFAEAASKVASDLVSLTGGYRSRFVNALKVAKDE